MLPLLLKIWDWMKANPEFATFLVMLALSFLFRLPALKALAEKSPLFEALVKVVLETGPNGPGVKTALRDLLWSIFKPAEYKSYRDSLRPAAEKSMEEVKISQQPTLPEIEVPSEELK